MFWRSLREVCNPAPMNTVQRNILQSKVQRLHNMEEDRNMYLHFFNREHWSTENDFINYILSLECFIKLFLLNNGGIGGMFYCSKLISTEATTGGVLLRKIF